VTEDHQAPHIGPLTRVMARRVEEEEAKKNKTLIL